MTVIDAETEKVKLAKKVLKISNVMNTLKEHGFVTTTTEKFGQANQHMLEQPEKKKITALAAKNNRGSLFIFQFAPHAAGYGSSTFLTVHITSELGLIIWNICF